MAGRGGVGARRFTRLLQCLLGKGTVVCAYRAMAVQRSGRPPEVSASVPESRPSWTSERKKQRNLGKSSDSGVIAKNGQTRRIP